MASRFHCDAVLVTSAPDTKSRASQGRASGHAEGAPRPGTILAAPYGDPVRIKTSATARISERAARDARDAAGQ